MSSSNSNELKSFLAGLSVQDKGAFAERCSTTVGYLNQIMYGNSKCSASLAIKIDKKAMAKLVVTCSAQKQILIMSATKHYQHRSSHD